MFYLSSVNRDLLIVWSQMARCVVTVSAYDNTDLEPTPAFDLVSMDFIESDEEMERPMTQIATGEATVGETNYLTEEPEALAEALDLLDEGLLHEKGR